MSWLILWIALSIPVSLLVGALIAVGNKSENTLHDENDLAPSIEDVLSASQVIRALSD